jgi:hypothetical protein
MRHTLFFLSALVCSLALASDRVEPRLYDVVITTSMPNLDENLRYTTTREERCLGHEDLTTAFPVLRHPALQGCTLSNEKHDKDDTLHYELVCESGHGTTGIAAWQIRDRRISGVLTVKMGGKNLIFGQRIDGTPLGPCTSDFADSNRRLRQV